MRRQRWACLVGFTVLMFSLAASAQSPTASSDLRHPDPVASSQAVERPLDALAVAFGDTFRRYHSEHFEILSDCDAGAIRRVLELAEDTFRGVSRFIVKLELPHRPLTGRMALILFEHYGNYARYARQAGFPASESVPGYFDEATGICVLFHFANSTTIRTQRDELWRQERALTTQQRFGHPSNDVAAAPTERDVAAARRALDAAQGAVIATVVRHEIAHQVLAATGVQSTAAGAARWLIEGTAMLFENADGTNRLRLADALAIPSRERLPLLRRVVEDPRLLAPDAGDASAAYAASWALVCYLAETQPLAMASFLLTPPGDTKAMDAFERRFGELDEIFVQRLYSYLEAQRP